jgi:hypothetical protein
MMNHQFTMKMAAALTHRLNNEAGSRNVQAAVKLAFQLAYGRTPDAEERQAAIKLIDVNGLRAFCRALLNSSEFIYVN